MTDTLSPGLDASADAAGPSKVFRSELNPVDFLRRAAQAALDRLENRP